MKEQEFKKDGLDHVFIHGSEKVVCLKFKEIPDDIDVDTITKIDYSNLYGEIVTAPSLLNKLGILKSQSEAILKEEEIDCKVLEAQWDEDIRKKLIGQGEKPTEKKVESEMHRKNVWKLKKFKVLQAQKNFNYMEALYWAFNDKCKKLDHFVKGVTPEDFADKVLEGTLNCMLIKKHGKTY